MTNTKFRKRALLSSVAMLLVALVALGSATFAWFSTRTNATAYGFTAATTKASNLSIKEKLSDAWASDIEFKANTADPSGALNPITTANGTEWKIATAAGQDLGYIAQASDLTDQAVSTSYMAYSTVYLKYGETPAEGTLAEKDLTVSITAKEGADSTRIKYVRVALVPVAEGSEASALGSAAVIVGEKKDDFGKSPATWVKPASGSAPSPSDSTTATTNLFGDTVKLGNMNNGTVYKYNVYVYFEGTDVDCKDTNAGGSLDDFLFTFNVADHTA